MTLLPSTIIRLLLVLLLLGGQLAGAAHDADTLGSNHSHNSIECPLCLLDPSGATNLSRCVEVFDAISAQRLPPLVSSLFRTDTHSPNAIRAPPAIIL